MSDMTNLKGTQIVDILVQHLIDHHAHERGNGVTFDLFSYVWKGLNWKAVITSDRGDNKWWLLEYTYASELLEIRELVQTGYVDITATL